MKLHLFSLVGLLATVSVSAQEFQYGPPSCTTMNAVPVVTLSSGSNGVKEGRNTVYSFQVSPENNLHYALLAINVSIEVTKPVRIKSLNAEHRINYYLSAGKERPRNPQGQGPDLAESSNLSSMTIKPMKLFPGLTYNWEIRAAERGDRMRHGFDVNLEMQHSYFAIMAELQELQPDTILKAKVTNIEISRTNAVPAWIIPEDATVKYPNSPCIGQYQVAMQTTEHWMNAEFE